MGQEADCTVAFGKQTSKGRAYLETDALIFRGSFRLAVPYSKMTSVQAQDGRLVVRFPGGVATFKLGARAATWAHKIQHPKSVMDKLGVKPGQRAAALGVTDAEFIRKLGAATGTPPVVRVVRGLDVIVFQVAAKTALARLRTLRAAITPDGAIWVVAPKGDARVREVDVLEAGRRAGLVDVKVVRFSDTHTAHKFIIPRSRHD